jgi:4-hydroxybutyrate CoA-transferase
MNSQPDFIRALNDRAHGTPIIAMQSMTQKGESKIPKMHPPGISLTASGFDGLVVVTEHGIADLRELTSGEKALAIASIAHPKFREELLRHVYDDPLFTKSVGFYLDDRPPRGVTLYSGDITLNTVV